MRTAQEHRTLLAFIRDENGATAIEYSLIASGISIAIAGAVTTLGEGVKATLYDKLAALF